MKSTSAFSATRRPGKRRLTAVLMALLLCSHTLLASTASEALPGADIASIHVWLAADNPQLKALQAEAEAADARIQPAGALPDPTASISLLGIDRDRPLLLPGQVGSTIYQLRQRFPLWGKRELAREVARAEARSLRLERDAVTLDLLAQAEEAFVRYWHAEESIKVIDRLIALLGQVEQVASMRYALGDAAQQDSIRAQVERTSIQRERIQRLASGDEAAADLNAVLGRRADAPLAQPKLPPVLDVVESSEQATLQELGHDAHPALQADIARVTAAMHAVELQRRNRFPDLTLGIGSMQLGSRLDSHELMLEVEIPFQQRARRERERESRLLEEAARARSEATRLELQRRAGTAWVRWSSAKTQHQLIVGTLLPQSEANFQSAISSYQVGEVDFATLLDAVRAWQGADLARVDVIRDELLGAVAVRALNGETP